MNQDNTKNPQGNIIIKEQNESSKPLSKRAKRRRRKRKRKKSNNNLSSRARLDQLIKNANDKYAGKGKSRSTFWDALSNNDKRTWEDFAKNLVKKDTDD